MNVPVIFQFLKELAANNNREWFNAHREQYEVARKEFEDMLTVLISRISVFDESVRHVEAKDCTYRIYRDTRFSEDKTPSEARPFSVCGWLCGQRQKPEFKSSRIVAKAKENIRFSSEKRMFCGADRQIRTADLILTN